HRRALESREHVNDANLVLYSLLGGTALLLSGVRVVGEGLQRAAGTRLRHILSTLTGNRLKALAVGAGATAILQSSSATTVMLVGFASAGLLTLRQTIGVILGADIGTTVTVQLLAFNVLGYAALVVFVGWFLQVTGRGTIRYVGQSILGFGFLFLGMKLVADGTAPLATSALFADFLRALTDQPLLLIILAAIFTGLVRSSAAVIGLALSLAASGLMPLLGAIPVILGANYLNPAVRDTPAVALGQALRETLRMGGVVLQSLRDTIAVLERDDERLMAEVIARDDLIDRLEEDIKQYLVKLREHSLTEEQSQRETALIFVIVNLEEIGDVIDKNLMELAEKKIRGNHVFSAQGWQEIRDLHAKVVENLELAMSALAAQDPAVAEKVIRHKANVNVLERQLRQTHISRLHSGLRESIDTSSIHLDLLAALKRANSLVTGIAYAVLGQ